MAESTIRSNGIVSLKDVVNEWVGEFVEDHFDDWELRWWEYDTGTYHRMDSGNPGSLFGGHPPTVSGDGQFILLLLATDGVVDG